MNLRSGRTISHKCETERMPDSHAKSLYLYRRGRAILQRGKSLGESWSAFIAGVIPKCAGPKVLP